MWMDSDNTTKIKRGKLIVAVERLGGDKGACWIFRVGEFTHVTEEDRPENKRLIGKPAITVKPGSGLAIFRSWREAPLAEYKFLLEELYEPTTQEKITYHVCMFYYRVILPAKKFLCKLVGRK